MSTTSSTIPFNTDVNFRDRDPFKAHSYSGADIQCFFFGGNLDPVIEDINQAATLTEKEKNLLKSKLLQRNKAVLPFAELQTLTISSTRSPGPIRRLGEIEPIEYKLGARTLAGTMIFSMLNRDIFSQYMDRIIPGMANNSWKGPDYVDEIPQFNILIKLGNELGRQASGILIDVKITNFGTTFSIDDMYTESTYNWVAKHYSPVVDDITKTLNNYEALKSSDGRPLSEQLIEDAKIVAYNNYADKYKRVSREMYEFYMRIPEQVRRGVIKYNIDVFNINRPDSDLDIFNVTNPPYYR